MTQYSLFEPGVKDREMARRSLVDFMQWDGEGKWMPEPFHRLICKEVQAVVEGTMLHRRPGRLLVCLPPRRGKSKICTRRGPDWMLGNYPDMEILGGSYSHDLIKEFCQEARDNFNRVGPALWGFGVSKGRASADNWGIDGHDGGMKVAGVGGGMTGKGCDILLLDDLIKNWEEANSQTIRNRAWNWLVTVAFTRFAPGASVIFTTTRWHPDDPAGRLLDRRNTMEGANDIPWTVISLPEIAKEGDLLGREPGELLWPNRFPAHEVFAMKGLMDIHEWAALYQQEPVPEGGMLFKKSDFRYFDEDDEYYILYTPAGEERILKSQCWIFQTVDPSATEKDYSDWFVCSTWAVTPGNDGLFLGMFREKIETTKHEFVMENELSRWEPAYQGIENKTFGLALIQGLKVKGLPVRAINMKGDKVAKARTAAARYNSGKIYHRKNADWTITVENELCSFPSGKHDDIVDTVSMFASEIAVSKRFFGEFSRAENVRARKIILYEGGTPVEDLFIRGWFNVYEHPACVVGQIDQEDNLILIDSFYRQDMTSDDFIREAKKWSLQYGTEFKDFTSSEDHAPTKKSVILETQFLSNEDVFASGLPMRPEEFVRMVRILLKGKPHWLFIDEKAEQLIKTFESGLTFEERRDHNTTGLPNKKYPWFSIWEATKQIVAGVFNPITLSPKNNYRCKEIREKNKAMRLYQLEKKKKGLETLWKA